MKSSAAPKRAYRLGARARAAEQTAERIIAAFRRRIALDWYDVITLEEIALEAGVTVATIIRRFGGKERLLETAWDRFNQEITARRTVAPGDLDGAVRVIVDDYEAVGDVIMRALMQEERIAALKRVNDRGRAFHRAWIEQSFAPWLGELSAAARRQRVDALVAATDLYTWKLVRRDMGRSPQHVRTLMRQLLNGALGLAGARSGETP
ncbi:MAG TPA: helix-turn-helix domain-containing protein [Vitreimonas sp.]|uniref:TetR/AcrR family transcriptional regulator n=1 Tax=Vitreimonas sp. TaxID=3069702 RepID=UPI002D2904A3|nr:helix-turn-helix domain-containing protein [Vitreimonas sp.]HYD85973.1 helix-turn-helix domain-containing protein [Vitreimonas sp.]